MGRFYFHLRAGDELISDDVGIDLPDLSAAKREAVLGARELLAEAIKTVSTSASHPAEVTTTARKQTNGLSFRRLFTRAGVSPYSRRADAKSTAEPIFSFNSSSRPERKRRSGSCRVPSRIRASAFSYEARASASRPSLRHRSARAEYARE